MPKREADISALRLKLAMDYNDAERALDNGEGEDKLSDLVITAAGLLHELRKAPRES